MLWRETLDEQTKERGEGYAKRERGCLGREAEEEREERARLPLFFVSTLSQKRRSKQMKGGDADLQEEGMCNALREKPKER